MTINVPEHHNQPGSGGSNSSVVSPTSPGKYLENVYDASQEHHPLASSSLEAPSLERGSSYGLSAAAAPPSVVNPSLDPMAAVAAVANSPPERRGSGFLLLAAEAYEAAERTQLRADAIRQVAHELASAAQASDPSSSAASAAAGSLLEKGALVPSSASEFLQGLASDSSKNRYSAGPGSAGAYPELDGSFREQVYMAAAMVHQKKQREQALSPTAAAAAKAPQQQGEEPTKQKRKRRPSAKAAKGTGSKSEKEKSLPPLPPAPLIQPTKKPATHHQGLKIKRSPSKDDGSSASKPQPSDKPRPKPQKHVYHDYSAIPDSSEFVRKKSGGVSMPFPEKLMDMLDKETILNPEVITWLPHGRAFLVRKPKLFTSEVMSGYFRQSKLTSFQRQLNLYGFRRITQGPDAGAYYHELFLQGRPQLCMRMQRQKVKGTGHKQPTDVTTEPDFYGMPALTDAGGNNGVVAME